MQFVPWCLRQELLAWDEEVVVKGEASGEFMQRGFKAAIVKASSPQPCAQDGYVLLIHAAVVVGAAWASFVLASVSFIMNNCGLDIEFDAAETLC